MSGAEKKENNGEYGLRNGSVPWAEDKPLYRHQDRKRFIFWVDGDQAFAIGRSKTRKAYFYISYGGQEEDCQPFEVGWEGVTVECSQFEDGKFE